MERSTEAPAKSAQFTWKRASVLAKLMVTASLLVWLVRQLDLTKTLDLLRAVHPGFMLLVFALTVVVIGMEARRWQLLLSAVQIRLPFREIWAISFMGNFFNYFLPSRMGGEAVRLYYATKLTGRPVEVILSVLLDRCVGVVGLMSVPWLVILIHRPADRLHEGVGLVYVAVSAFLLLAISLSLLVSRHSTPPVSAKPDTRLRALLRSLSGLLHLYKEQKGILLQALGIAVASHLLNIGIYVGLGTALGEGHRWRDFVYLIPMTVLATLLPVSLGGLGVREWTFVSLFTELGMPRQIALSISLLTLLVKIGASLIGAALYLARGRPRHA